MDRRSFLLSAGAASVSLAAGEAHAAMKTRYYSIENYEMKNGTQGARLAEYFSKHRIPALQKIHEGPILVLEAVFAPHMPQVSFICGYSSLDQFAAVTSKMSANADLAKAVDEWERGAEQPYEAMNNLLIEATPYSPELSTEKRKTPRYFEWRYYHSPSTYQLKALHERFAGPEIKIFHRSGVHPVLYASTLVGPNMPNLTYLIPFDSLDAREKAWAAFSGDPEWVKVRKESVDRNGQISQSMNITLWKTAAYSPVG